VNFCNWNLPGVPGSRLDSISTTPHGVILSEERSDESKDPYRGCPTQPSLG